MRWPAVAAVAVAFAAAVVACGPRAAERAPARAGAAADRRIDEHSYAEPARVRVRTLRLELRADFAARQLAGTAALELTWLLPAPYRLILDTRDLVIERVEAPDGRGTWRAAPFTLGERDPILGSPLVIELERAAPEVRIAYHTQPQ